MAGKPRSCVSKTTARPQVPALFRSAELGPTNIDIGGGPYVEGTRYLKRRGVRNLVHDPCHDLHVPAPTRGDTVTVSNTLNVIKSAAERRRVLEQAKRRLKPGGEAFIAVYEGDGSCRTRKTPHGHQRNCPTASYMPMVRQVFGNVERRGRMLVARRKR